MSGGKAYTCDACRHRKRRCESCQAKHREMHRAWRSRQRAAGLCLQCTEPVEPGYTRCADHVEINRVASQASHALARAEGRE